MEILRVHRDCKIYLLLNLTIENVREFRNGTKMGIIQIQSTDKKIIDDLF